jgi:hypothetical protein
MVGVKLLSYYFVNLKVKALKAQVLGDSESIRLRI